MKKSIINKSHLYPELPDGQIITNFKCPKCNSFANWSDSKGLIVNCVSTQKVNLQSKWLDCNSACNNPFCEWSKIGVQ